MHWVYHKTHQAKIVKTDEEYNQHLENGWLDSPYKEVENTSELTSSNNESEIKKYNSCEDLSDDSLKELEETQRKRPGRPPKL